MDLQKFASNQTKEKEGVWIDLDETTRVKIARMDNPAFKKAMQKELGPYKQAVRSGTLSEQQSEKIMSKVLAETILVGWEGMTDGGKELPYTAENACRILATPHLKDFRTMIVGFSEDAALFREAQLEDAEKNSVNGSDGK